MEAEGEDEEEGEEKEKEEDVAEQPRDYERPKRIDPHNTAATLMTGRSQNADATCLAIDLHRSPKLSMMHRSKKPQC